MVMPPSWAIESDRGPGNVCPGPALTTNNARFANVFCFFKLNFDL